MTSLRLFLLFCWLLFVTAPNVIAQEKRSKTFRRVALVIGNTNYINGQLTNPVNDANAVAKSLKNLGFQVETQFDRNKFEIEKDIDLLTDGLKEGDAVFFFYAGHGVQLKNTNFIVPIGAKIEREFHVRQRCVELDYVLAAMEDSGASLKVVMLDACRDNPFRSFTRSKKTGLASVEAPSGTIIAFSTAPGVVALDGAANNSPFTKHLVETLKSHPSEGLEINDVFRTVARAVRKETGQRAFVTNDASMDPFLLKAKIPRSTNADVRAKNRIAPFESYSGLEDIDVIRQHASHGIADAQSQLAHLYSRGISTDQDYNEAFKWGKRSAEQGNARGLAQVGIAYEYGRGVQEDPMLAMKHYRLAAAKGNGLAKVRIGQSYISGNGVKKNSRLGKQWLMDAFDTPPTNPSDESQLYAAFYLGIFYRFDVNADKDLDKAVKWFEEAAKGGFALAQIHLGEMYRDGIGVNKDSAKALKWFKKAAKQDSAVAMAQIGYLYDKGIGIQKDAKEAAKWYREAAKRGDKNGQFALGFFYRDGNGVKKDGTEALKWFKKAAQKNMGSAMSNIGLIYEKGTGGVPIDYEKAVMWYRKATDQGDAFGQNNLGYMYLKGKGLPKDLEKAKFWFKKAAEQGNQLAKQNLKAVEVNKK